MRDLLLGGRLEDPAGAADPQLFQVVGVVGRLEPPGQVDHGLSPTQSRAQDRAALVVAQVERDPRQPIVLPCQPRGSGGHASGQPDHLDVLAGGEQMLDHGGADVARRAGDDDPHETSSSSPRSPRSPRTATGRRRSGRNRAYAFTRPG